MAQFLAVKENPGFAGRVSVVIKTVHDFCKVTCITSLFILQWKEKRVLGWSGIV